jgi:hypothetical protein
MIFIQSFLKEFPLSHYEVIISIYRNFHLILMEVQIDPAPTEEQRQQFTDLKKRISGAHKTNPFAERLREVIVASATISGSGSYLGVIKSESGGLSIRSKSFGEFLGLRPNSINKNLRHFGFQRNKNPNALTELRSLLPNMNFQARTWALWNNTVDTFNEFTTDDQLEKFTAHAYFVRHFIPSLSRSSLFPPSSLSLTSPSSPSSHTQESLRQRTELSNDSEFNFDDDFWINFFKIE